MSDTDGQVPLPDLNGADAPPIDDVAYNDEQASRVAADLEACLFKQSLKICLRQERWSAIFVVV